MVMLMDDMTLFGSNSGAGCRFTEQAGTKIVSMVMLIQVASFWCLFNVF